jgi:spore maturation protein CgeB
MIEAGYSPSVRLFEAAACGTPIISDEWPGLSTILVPGREVLLAKSSREVLVYLRELADEERQAISSRARRRILGSHTAAHRAAELEGYVAEVRNARSGVTAAGSEPAAARPA